MLVSSEHISRMAAEPLLLRDALAACAGLRGKGFRMRSSDGALTFHVAPWTISVVANEEDDAVLRADARDGLDWLRAAMRAHGLAPVSREWSEPLGQWLFFDAAAEFAEYGHSRLALENPAVRDHGAAWKFFSDAVGRAHRTRACACGRALVVGERRRCFACVLDPPADPADAESQRPDDAAH